MNSELVSKKVLQFYDVLMGNGLAGGPINDRIKRAIRLVENDVHLGKCEVIVESVPNAYEPNGFRDGIVLYCGMVGYEEEPYKEKFNEDLQGVVEFAFYPQRGYQWTEDETRVLRFLMQSIYSVYGYKRLLKIIKKVLTTDNVTGAVNLSGMMQYGGKLLENSRLCDFAGLFMNLKNFKYINQSVGRKEADELLRRYVTTVQDFLLPSEMFARPGGDNFIALIHKERVKEFLRFLSRISFTVNVNGKNERYDITARIGIYNIQPEDSLVYSLDCATVALGISKRRDGEDYIWFRNEMLNSIIHEKEISNTFIGAVKNEEFVVYYQPKVNLSDKCLCGCEALVRWIQNGKIVPPMEFIPVLEREGTVCILDFYVLEKVCQDIRRWIDNGIEPVRTSVNFSKLHLRKANFVDEVLEVLRKYRVDSKYIEIELTETSGYEDFKVMENCIASMKRYGLSISIDDFGNGYSSLNMIKNLDVDIVKMDKAFVDGLLDERESSEIFMRNLIKMINELQMDVIAEGVETEEQAEFLQSVDCQMVQGFLFDKPLACDEFEKRLNSQYEYYQVVGKQNHMC